MKTFHFILPLLFTFCWINFVKSQQNTLVAGAEATGVGTVSYSIGQIDFNSNSGSNGSVHQGVQQPLEFFNLSLPEQALSFQVILFPNPTLAELHVKLSELQITQNSFVLVDAAGREVLQQEIHQPNFSINMENLSRGSYYLNFFQYNRIVGSYQVIKK